MDGEGIKLVHENFLAGKQTGTDISRVACFGLDDSIEYQFLPNPV